MRWLPSPRLQAVSLQCAGASPLKRLSGLHLRVPDPAALAAFYTDVMGMQAQHLGDTWRVGYVGADADLILMPSLVEAGAQDYVSARTDRYWKIGICQPDLDMAYDQLCRRGVAVSAPRQFLDIGYMAHLTDPAGCVIELLQHDFDGTRQQQGNTDLPLGGDGHIGQITLRTGNITAELAAHEDMTLLSVQDVADYGFDLYFLAYTAEQPPNQDLRAVENRPWLWRRPYTTLEFQHLAGATFEKTDVFDGLEITENSATGT
ncbi:lactoylglutathione lyase [Phaeobacter sp. CECT 5382]|nr:lactoylglutathione lyase [Phaeobacter sp. CECT 5382]